MENQTTAKIKIALYRLNDLNGEQLAALCQVLRALGQNDDANEVSNFGVVLCGEGDWEAELDRAEGLAVK